MSLEPSLSSSMSRTNKSKQGWGDSRMMIPDLKDVGNEGSENDFDLEDSMPNFIIKPFEQSIE